MLRSLSAVLLACTLVACEEPAPEAPVEKEAPVAQKPAPDKADKADKAVPSQAPDPMSYTIPPKTKKVDCSAHQPPAKVDVNSLELKQVPDDAHPGVLDPKQADMTAPESFKVRFETTEGDFVVQAHRAWAPIGVDRFYSLVKIGWYDDTRFFRAVEGFMIQFGINGAPRANFAWQNARIKDDPVVAGNKRGFVTFAQCSAPNCRKDQLFLNTKDNSFLDRQRFAAIGVVVEGMDVVDRLYTCYGEGAPSGQGPRQDLVSKAGNAYLDAGYPNLSAIKKATIFDVVGGQ